MTAHRYRLLNALLVLALFAASAWAYPRLPERIPVHFGLGGQPDRWESRSPLTWFLLPVIAAAMALGVEALSAWAVRHPGAWNLPRKDHFLDLDADAQAPIVARMQAFVAFVGVVVTALFCVLQAGMYGAARGTSQAMPAWTLGGMFAALLVIAVAAAALNGRLDGMIRDADAAE